MMQGAYHTVLFNDSSKTMLDRTDRQWMNHLPSKLISQTNKLGSKHPLMALEYVVSRLYQVLRYIEKSGPYIDKYGPIIKEVPTLYKMMTILNEIDDDSVESTETIQGVTPQAHLSNLKLFI